MRAAASNLRATVSFVSPKKRRRSEWPISTKRHPTSRNSAPPTSPVKGPESSQNTSWAPTLTGVPANLPAAALRTVKLGKTAISTRPSAKAGSRWAIAPTRSHQSTVWA